MRKWAGRLAEMSEKEEEIANFLASIPEWAEYFEGEYKKMSEIESKQLGKEDSNEKKKNEEKSPSEDYLNFMF